MRVPGRESAADTAVVSWHFAHVSESREFRLLRSILGGRSCQYLAHSRSTILNSPMLSLLVAEGTTTVWLVAQLSSMSNSSSWSICHHLPSYHIFVGEQLLSYFPGTASSGSCGLSSGTTGPTE